VQSKEPAWQSGGYYGATLTILVVLIRFRKTKISSYNGEHPSHKGNNNRMKIKHLVTILIISMLALLLSACTGAGTTTSWAGALLTDTNVYFANGAQVYSLRAENGNIAWQYPEKASPTRLFYAEPALVGEQLIVGDYGKLLTSLSIRDGRENWQFKEAKGRYIDSPLIVGDLIIAPNADYHLYALDLTGVKKWVFEAEHAFWARPVSDGKTVFAPSMDHNLYAVDLTTGKLVWKVDLGASLVARPLLVDDVIYLGNLDGGFYAVNATNGKIVWTQKVAGGIWAAPLLVDGQLYFGDQIGKINILNSENGKIIQAVDAGSAVLGTGSVLTDGIAFGTESGKLYMVEKDGKSIVLSTLAGSLYSNLVTSGERLLVIVTKGTDPLVMMDFQGRTDPSFVFSIKK
jgi:outer membrane protein assembly factor BamB